MNVQLLCALGRIFKLHVVQCRRHSNLQNKATQSSNYDSCGNNVSRHTVVHVLQCTCIQCNVPIRFVVNNGQDHVLQGTWYSTSPVRVPHSPLYWVSLQLTICSMNLQAVQEESMKKKVKIVFCIYLILLHCTYSTCQTSNRNVWLTVKLTTVTFLLGNSVLLQIL